MSEDLLQTIQRLQFSDQNTAQELLTSFIQDTFRLDVVKVELRPVAVSLNSFNGFVTVSDGTRLFFKTHTEPDNVIGEYYNAERLATSGYPVIQPIFISTEAGKQFLIYKEINDPSVFDVAWDIENGDSSKFTALVEAQHHADNLLERLFHETYAFQSSEAALEAPIHQLFYHRLIGGRFTRFYGAIPGQAGNQAYWIDLPGVRSDMGTVRKVYWHINGQEYHISLDDLVISAVRLLTPGQPGPSIIGHGDAHNGNIFLQEQNGIPSLLYFDPAFAGRHDPLLDLTKPLFHNVFAMWMYFPREKTALTHITLNPTQDAWSVEHDYTIHSVREMFLRSKIERVLIPTLRVLKEKDALRSDWRAYLKAALFCCPLLTMNLADPGKFTPEMSLLGLTMAIEMGADSYGQRSLIDRTLDEVEQAII